MFRQEMRNSPAKPRGVRVCNHESALNDAIGLELALDAYHVIRTQKHVCRKMQAIFGDVHDFAEPGRVILRHEAAP